MFSTDSIIPLIAISNKCSFYFLLDILIYAEPAKKVFVQGFFAFLGNIIVVGILGTLLALGYAKVGGKSSSLSKED